VKHRARKRFGQNFLHQDSVIQRIITSINPKKGQHLVEIGPGRGALTFPILKSVGKLQALEIDRDLIAELKVNSIHYGELEIIEGDVLSMDFATLGDNLHIFGNLPYNISTPLLLHLFKAIDHIESMCFMLQKEVVLRLAAEHGIKAYGRLSVITQYYCDVEYLFTVPPQAFTPAPKVESAIVRLTPKKNRLNVKDLNLFESVVASAFSMKRKTLANNLKGMLTKEELSSLGLDPGQRAETLTVSDFVMLANTLHDRLNLG
jgi:16S rRNA (adenine1518-N6/adenine1519-N6)-dimethyltransferase